MPGPAADLLPRDRGDLDEPWAYAVNQTAASPDVELTLLTVAFVDDVVWISGFGRMQRRAEIRLAGLPVLCLAPTVGASLFPLGGHVVPNGRSVWVSWVYQRPLQLGGPYEARVEQMDVGSRGGRWRPEPLAGPWVFHFRLPLAVRPVRLMSRFD